MNALRPYAQLVRLPNTFTAPADILVGSLALGSVVLWDRPGSLVCLLFASVCLYWSGMVWNDYFDLAQDRRERPGRPIASGRVTPRAAALLGTALMLGGLLLALLADVLPGGRTWVSLPIAVALIAAIFAYDAWLKRTWAGPIAMGSCRFLNVLLGLSAAGAWPPRWGWLLALVVGVYIAGVTWFARTEARVSNQSMLLGAAAVILAGLLLALGVPALAQQESAHFEPSPLFPYLLTGFALYLALAVVPAVRRPQPEKVQAAVQRSVLGLVLFDAILASALVGTLGLLLAVLILPGVFLSRRLYST